MNALSAYVRPPSIKLWQLSLALLIMASAMAAAEFFKPSRFWSDELGNPRYEHIMPKAFGDWVQMPGAAAAVVNPQQAEMLDKIYSETVSRVYYNQRTGRAIMLSIAYGRDQSTDTQLHTPDMCYSSQGFKVEANQPVQIKTPWGPMPAVHLQTGLGQRPEPLTYFIRTGDRLTTQGSLDRNLARLGMALRGYKIDGLLVRVSEVTRQDDAFAVQDQFLIDMIAAIPPSERAKVIGRQALSAL